VSIPPNSGLVAVAWTRGIAASGPFDPSRVATKLPSDDAPLALGFVQLTTVGGTPDIDIPARRPVVQVDAWAAGTNGGKPPAGRAWVLAEVVRLATEHTAYRRTIAMPSGYDPARVMCVRAISEPREVLSDPGRYARVQFDMIIDWSSA
jgi:hypothetical protein